MKIRYLQYGVSFFFILIVLIFSNLFEVLSNVQSYDSSTSEVQQIFKNLKVFHFEKTIDVERDRIFNLIYDVSSHPYVLPNNILNVKILEKNEFSVIAEETLTVQGLKVTMLVNYKKIGNDEQQIRILNGPAQNSKISLKYIETEFGTIIITDAVLEFKKPLSLITQFMNESNFHSAFNYIVNEFVKYANK